MPNRTKLDIINEVLGLLDISTVITSTDTHPSRVLSSLMPLTLFALEQEYDWVELIADTPVNELELVIQEYVGSGNSGFRIPYFTRIHKVVDTDHGVSLRFVNITRFEQAFPTGFIYTADLTSVTVDSSVHADSDGQLNELCAFSMHNNTVYVPPTLNWSRVKVVHTKPLTIPANDSDTFDAPDYLANLYVIALAYRYASMYSPARNDFAAARVSGLKNMYEQTVAVTKSRMSPTPIKHKRSLI